MDTIKWYRMDEMTDFVGKWDIFSQHQHNNMHHLIILLLSRFTAFILFSRTHLLWPKSNLNIFAYLNANKFTKNSSSSDGRRYDVWSMVFQAMRFIHTDTHYTHMTHTIYIHFCTAYLCTPENNPRYLVFLFVFRCFSSARYKCIVYKANWNGATLMN